MNNFPLVSVVIPCYNAENFVRQSVCSILNQTYKNLEIIVINDCSTDNTAFILKNLASKDKRISYIENEVNLKLSQTLNKGLALAKGEYIARMDADDISLPTRIEQQVAFLNLNKDIDMVGCNAQLIDENNILTNKRTYREKDHQDIIKVMPYKCPFTHPSVIARKSFFQDVGEFKEISYGEDYEYWIRAWLAGKKFANLPLVLINYRIHSQQMSGIGFNPNNARQIQKFLFFYFLKTKNIKFLFGVLCHTRLASALFERISFLLRSRICLKFRS